MCNKIEKKKGIPLETAARKMADILEDHFASLPESEREKRIKAFESAVAESAPASPAVAVKQLRRIAASRA